MGRLQVPGACWHKPGHSGALLDLALTAMPCACSSLNQPKPFDYSLQNELSRDLISPKRSKLQGYPTLPHPALLKRRG